jgi:hypothetical protein
MQHHAAAVNSGAARYHHCLLIITAALCRCFLQLRFDEGFDEASSTHTPEQLPEYACA